MGLKPSVKFAGWAAERPCFKTHILALKHFRITANGLSILANESDFLSMETRVFDGHAQELELLILIIGSK